MQLIVAEKPSVARDLARVLGIRPAGQHCFEGTDRVITWCIGHLVELEEPAAYDARWKRWHLDTLPMLPPELRLRAAPHARDQLGAVARLLRDRRFRSVVNACDAGREGELIFRYVYQYSLGGGGGPPVLRLWVSSLTDEAIRRGFAALRPGAQLDPLGDAARSRSEADWLVGMNATRAVTARGREAGHAALYSIGRVQTPTLAMLVARERAIRAFVPRPYWEVRAELRTEAGERFTAGWRHGAVARLGAAALAEAICARDREAPALVERVRARTVREPPPLLFDLTSLQRTANRRFGLSAARTLELAQALYERHKLLTYPRTDSRHLSSDLVGELPAVIDALGEVPDYAAFAAELRARPLRPGRRVVDDTRVSDHHAIIPTGKPARLEALDRDERRIFDLVARRFLGAFFPDAELAVTEVWIRVGAAGTAPPLPPPARDDAPPPRDDPPDGDRPILEQLPPPPDRYLARGRVRLVAGWQAVAGFEPREPSSDDRPDGALPALTEGQRLAGTYAPLAKHTTPPPRYTEATLLGAMESAGASIDDEALRRAMKDCGLGTPATRAAIIETLLRRGYLDRDRQHLVPTAIGLALIEALPVASLASPELTGQWEARLARIARGEDSRASFMADIERYVRELVDAVRGWDPPAALAEAAPASPPSRGPRGRGGPRASYGRTRSRASYGRASSRPRRGPGRRGADRAAPDRATIGSDHRDAESRGAADRTTDTRRARPRTRRTPSPRRAANERSTRAPNASSTRVTANEATTPAAANAASTRATANAASANAPVSPSTKRGAGRVATVPPLEVQLGCPRCGEGALMAGARGWGCTRWRDGCGFVVWFETAGRRLSAAQLRDLVTRGRTRKARFVAPDGAEREGRLVLDPAANGGAARFVPA